MTMRLFAVAACIVTFVSLPAGAGQPSLPNGDAVDAINVNVVRGGSGLTATREVTFDFCAGDFNLFAFIAGIPPTDPGIAPGLVVKACPTLGSPVLCEVTSASVVSVTPGGGCVSFECVYTFALAGDPRGDTGTSLDEGNELVETRFTFTPTLEDLTGVTRDEYYMLLNQSKNGEKKYLATRADDPSVTFMTIRERAFYTASTLPDNNPVIFEDGFESGDTSAWSQSSSPTDLSTVP